jgi:hypothetical protein
VIPGVRSKKLHQFIYNIKLNPGAIKFIEQDDDSDLLPFTMVADQPAQLDYPYYRPTLTDEQFKIMDPLAPVNQLDVCQTKLSIPENLLLSSTLKQEDCKPTKKQARRTRKPKAKPVPGPAPAPLVPEAPIVSALVEKRHGFVNFNVMMSEARLDINVATRCPTICVLRSGRKFTMTAHKTKETKLPYFLPQLEYTPKCTKHDYTLYPWLDQKGNWIVKCPFPDCKCKSFPPFILNQIPENQKKDNSIPEKIYGDLIGKILYDPSTQSNLEALYYEQIGAQDPTKLFLQRANPRLMVTTSITSPAPMEIPDRPPPPLPALGPGMDLEGPHVVVHLPTRTASS